ncbi:MAG: GAF domain-containing protein [Alkalilacustris sp.]
MADGLDAGRFDIAAALDRLGRAQALPGQPGALYEAFEALCAETVGHRLFTLLAWHPETGEVARVHTSRPDAYPLRGRKPMGPTPWGAQVLHAGQPWLGSSAEDIVWAFPDHALIASLGCASCLSAPVRWDGRVLGVTAVLDVADAYTEADLAGLCRLAPLLAPGFLTLAKER